MQCKYHFLLFIFSCFCLLSSCIVQERYTSNAFFNISGVRNLLIGSNTRREVYILHICRQQAQQQALSRRVTETKVYNRGSDQRCREGSAHSSRTEVIDASVPAERWKWSRGATLFSDLMLSWSQRRSNIHNFLFSWFRINTSQDYSSCDNNAIHRFDY